MWKYLGDFFRQFRALAWKNKKLKLRSWTVLALEIAIPTAVIFALGFLKGVIKPTPHPEISPRGSAGDGGVQSLRWMYDSAYCGGTTLLWRCTSGDGPDSGDLCPEPDQSNNWNQMYGWKAATSDLCVQQMIAVAPLSTTDISAATAASKFVTWANTRNAYNSNGVTLAPTFKLFNSEQEFLDVLEDKLYSFEGDVFSSAIVFGSGFPAWDYTVRLNKTFNTNWGQQRFDISTSLPPVDNSLKSSQEDPPTRNGDLSPYYRAWIDDGYVPLTNEVNTFIATETCVQAGKCTSETFEYQLQQSDPFPSAEYETTGFWGALGFVFSLDMILVLLYPLSNVISVLVREKEAKLREGMKMMSLKSEVLWISWWFNFMALFLPLSLLLTYVGKKLFEHSDTGMIFLYFIVFFLSATSFAIFVSTFFTNSRTAAIVGSLLFLGGFLSYVGIQTTNPTRTTILLACLHPATAFTFSTLAFAEYEDTSIGVTSFTWDSSASYNVTFRDCLMMMLIDCVWLTGCTWYIDKIWPSEYGTQEPWYFIVNPFYWGKIFGFFVRAPSSKVGDEVGTDSVNVELVSENLRSQFEDHTCVDIRNLRKEFMTPQGVMKVAVNGLNLTMYQGQITALLGHNGAGKTTAIAMLTGLIPADGGTAIIEGMDIREDMDEIRKNLGVCPQHDVLFPELTVEEHLSMFAMFKGVKGNELDNAVQTMVASIGLTEKRHTASKLLSGGQKRKLSVGIAFIGGSRVVFLDEPTSGMDPYSRRFTWNVIRQHREGRVIVLTTHFMDEADLLGDRIAIMGDGKLCCCGSSLYLKNLYGVGYSMTIEKKNAATFNSEAMTTLVTSHVADSLVLNDVGTEMSFQLPFTASVRFPALFENIEQNLANLGIDSYGISVTTLEEVFIKITRATSTNTTAEEAMESSDGAENTSDSFIVGNQFDEETAEQTRMMTTAPKRLQFEKIAENEHLLYFGQHIKALMIKRAFYFVRDRKAQIFTFIVPILFLLAGLIIMTNTYPSAYEPFLRVSIDLYNTKVAYNKLPTPYANPALYRVTYEDRWSGNNWDGPTQNRDANSVAAAQAVLDSIALKANFPLLNVITGDGGSSATTPYNVTKYLMSHKNDFEAMIVGTYTMRSSSMKSVEYTVSTNYTAVYGVPVYQQMMADATVRSLFSSASVATAIYPFPETKRQSDLFQNFNVDLVVTFIMLSIPFVPAAFITYVVREKEVKSKQQQMVSGVGVIAYWVSTFLWDNLSFCITTCFFAFLVAGPIFGEDTPNLGGGGSKNSAELVCFFELLFLFGASVSGFAYMISYLFKAPSNAQIVMIFISFITGLVLSLVGIVLRILPDTKGLYHDYLRYLLCLFPPFALGDGLHNMALINLWSALENGGTLYKVSDWEITGIPITMMGFEAIGYLGLTICIEYLTSIPKVQQFVDSLHVTLPETNQSLKDEDVLEEERRCNAGEFDNSSTILVKNLKKQFYGGMRTAGKYAVQGISLAIPNGQCFGLLGINGAGKTTTLSMLSGEFAPSAGEAYLGGLNLLTDIHKCRRKVGFCPQFDSLFELLTAREHLELYSRIKGIKESDIDAVVGTKIREMGLTEYADRYAGTFSGGNKRKLSVAIAMIGEPSIVFLDEPSTGMDPVARRFMWEVISDIVTKREKCSLILTTHSMEECEALCTRIGIMVGGVLRCLGSAQKLRNRYGDGYQIEIGMSLPPATAINDFCKSLLSTLNLPIATTQSIVAASDGSSLETDVVVDNQITRDEVKRAFLSSHGNPAWLLHLAPDGNGADLHSALEAHNFVHLKHLASWMILERQYDAIVAFLQETFGYHMVRERQATKIRIEVKSVNIDGSARLLSSIFSAIEKNRKSLAIQDYSVSQTSLEQIFNFFAAQQEEETGAAAGISNQAHIAPQRPNVTTTLAGTAQSTAQSVALSTVPFVQVPLMQAPTPASIPAEIEMTTTGKELDDMPPEYEVATSKRKVVSHNKKVIL